MWRRPRPPLRDVPDVTDGDGSPAGEASGPASPAWDPSGRGPDAGRVSSSPGTGERTTVHEACRTGWPDPDALWSAARPRRLETGGAPERERVRDVRGPSVREPGARAGRRTCRRAAGTPCLHGHRAQVADPDHRLVGLAHGDARRQHRQHRPARDRARPSHRPDDGRVGRRRLPPGRRQPVCCPFGRLGEVQTFKRVYLAGFAIFTVASVCCGAAPTIGWLVGFRVVQAAGAGMIMAMGPAIVARTFPATRARAGTRPQRDQRVDRAQPRAGARRPPDPGRHVAGHLPDQRPDRAPRDRLGRPRPPGRDAAARASRSTCGAPHSRVSPSSRSCSPSATGQRWGWTSPAVVGLVGASVVLGGLFLVAERRSIQPLLDLALFRIRPFSAGLASVVVAFAGLFTATFLLPFLLEQGSASRRSRRAAAHAGPDHDGPGGAVQREPLGPLRAAVLASIGHGGSWPSGSSSLTQLPVDFAVPDLVWRLVLLGVGQGLFMSPNSSAVLGSVPRPRVGHGLGHAGPDAGQRPGPGHRPERGHRRDPPADPPRRAGGSPAAQQEALGLAIHDAFVVAAAVCALGIVTSLVRGTARPGAADEAARRMDAAASEAASG